MTGAPEERFGSLVERPGDFMGASPDYRSARAVLFGIPMDFTTSYRPGTRLGPQRIREASYGLETYSPHLDRDLEDVSFCDIGDVAVQFGNPAASLDKARQVASGILADDKLPVMMGGEHLVTLPMVEAALEKYPNLAVVQFDAHADLREHYTGERMSHAAVMRRIIERVGGSNVYQFGIRSGPREEFAFGRETTHFYPFEVARPFSGVIHELKGRPVYVTLDIDVVDPAFAPGTGTPEPGGISSSELLETMRKLGQLRVVGFDVVEVMPQMDLSERTVLLAAKVIREVLLALIR